ncbi:DUF4333 domain-containing protein [Nocardia sp. NPDC005978]|uniref:DUF4333 domain-containing protein n=1 Tax=Nocardia sp. NPDC005978 TaxID=3156725 RepID=UPI0033B452C6
MRKNAVRTATVSALASAGVIAACLLPGQAHAAANESIGGGIDLGSIGAPDRLDNDSVGRGITLILRDSYGIDDVTDIACPERMLVTPGSEYLCTVNVPGAPKNVTIRIVDLDGTYEVGRPE